MNLYFCLLHFAMQTINIILEQMSTRSSANLPEIYEQKNKNKRTGIDKSERRK